MPGTATKEPERDMPAKGDNVQRITNISQPTLTVFHAPKKNVAAPAAIICPGGGYNYVVYDKEGTELATNEPNGVFRPREHASEDPAWIAYIVAAKNDPR